MLYVQKNNTVAVPKVYALYTESSTGRNFIVMEYIEGSTLASAWPDLNPLQKSTITAKLGNFYHEIRQLPSLGYFGSLGRRPLVDETFWTRENVPSINGPFETEDERGSSAKVYIRWSGLLQSRVSSPIPSSCISGNSANIHPRRLSA